MSSPRSDFLITENISDSLPCAGFNSVMVKKNKNIEKWDEIRPYGLKMENPLLARWGDRNYHMPVELIRKYIIFPNKKNRQEKNLIGAL